MSALYDKQYQRINATENGITLFSSAARTSSANSSDVTRSGGRGVRVYLDITAASGTTPTLDIKLQAKDELTGNYYDIPSAAFAQKTTTGTDSIVVYPGLTESANAKISDCITRTWRAVATIGGTTPSFTFSLSAEYLD